MDEKRPETEAVDLITQRQFWNGWFADVLEKESFDPSTLRRDNVVLQLARSLGLSKPEILEVGCGAGWLSARLAHFGHVTGVDLADKAVAAAKCRHPHIHFVAGDFLTLDLSAQRFDLVVSVGVISYFNDQGSFLDRISAVLKSRGYLILVCPHKFIWDRIDFVRRSHGEIPLNWLNMSGLKRLLRHDFCLLRSDTIIPEGNRGVLRLINSHKLNALIKKMIPEVRIVTIKERIGLGKLLVVVAQKRV
jgi:SAM-dependent methyltransferase